MLIKYSLSYNTENLRKIIQKDSEPFEFFKSNCNQNNINAVGVTLQKNDNQTPVLSVYITNTPIPEETIAKLWQETYNKYSIELSDCYVENTPIKTYQYHELYYNNFTRANKENINALLIEKYNIPPKHIFASSTGYLTLIYHESDYAQIEKDIDNIKANILAYSKNIMLNELGIDSLPELKINIFHDKMLVDLYGYSRED